MASVHLDFTPSTRPDEKKLRIYESATREGVFSEIEVVDPVGTYPGYLSEYTTDQATAGDWWFSIQWEDTKGSRTEMSEPWQGGTSSIPGLIVQRVMLRDPLLDENVVRQEAEAVVEDYFGVNPYSMTAENISYKELSGLTLLTMAHAYIGVLIQTSVSSTTADDWTAGLVSMRAGTSSSASATKISLDMVKELIDEANRWLGRNFSLILHIEEAVMVDEGGISIDQSRLIIELP